MTADIYRSDIIFVLTLLAAAQLPCMPLLARNAGFPFGALWRQHPASLNYLETRLSSVQARQCERVPVHVCVGLFMLDSNSPLLFSIPNLLLTLTENLV
jgi:hypothetical protein